MPEGTPAHSGPQVVEITGDYTIPLNAANSVLYLTGTATKTLTIESNGTIPLRIGSGNELRNAPDGGVVTIVGMDTLECLEAGGGLNGHVGPLALAPGGVAQTRKVAATKTEISGTGLSDASSMIYDGMEFRILPRNDLNDRVRTGISGSGATFESETFNGATIDVARCPGDETFTIADTGISSGPGAKSYSVRFKGDAPSVSLGVVMSLGDQTTDHGMVIGFLATDHPTNAGQVYFGRGIVALALIFSAGPTVDPSGWNTLTVTDDGLGNSGSSLQVWLNSTLLGATTFGSGEDKLDITLTGTITLGSDGTNHYAGLIDDARGYARDVSASVADIAAGAFTDGLEAHVATIAGANIELVQERPIALTGGVTFGTGGPLGLEYIIYAHDVTYGEIEDTAFPLGADDRTLYSRVKVDSAASGTHHIPQEHGVGSWDAGSHGGLCTATGGDAGNTLNSIAASDLTTDVNGPPDCAPYGTWYSYSAVVDGGLIRCVLNGVTKGGPTDTSMNSIYDTLRFGSHGDDATLSIDGWQTDIRYYRRAKTDAEIRNMDNGNDMGAIQ